MSDSRPTDLAADQTISSIQLGHSNFERRKSWRHATCYELFYAAN
jgi:hypothetical protein